MPSQKTQPKATDIIAQVAERIRTSDNVLVALSKDPSVDELSAALGLTFMLDKIGKRATAIFSGAIPNAIEFLEPEKTFEANTDSLQDFIIALDKEKADHLRYKIDGDYVKVFITPYKTTINESDMEFSHGDYNVDLVISLNVSEVGDLDAALSEYGRIMHDATSINITAGVAGNFGDIEWGDPEASSVSEMNLTVSWELNALPEFSVLKIVSKSPHNLGKKYISVFLLEFGPLSIYIIVGEFKHIADILLVGTVKYGSRHIDAQCLSSKA